MRDEMTRAVMRMSVALCAVLMTAAAAPIARASDTCPNAAYRHGSAANLADCRAWEQITPTDKDGQPITQFVGYPTDNGDRLSYFSNANAGGAPTQSLAFPALFSSVRGSAWTTRGLDPPIDSVPGVSSLGPPTRGLSPDRTAAVSVSLSKLTPDAVEGASNFYRRDTADGTYTLLVSVPGASLRDYFLASDSVNPTFIGGSPSFERVLIPNAFPDVLQGEGLYLTGDHGVQRLPDAAVFSAVRFVSKDGRVTYGGADGLYQYKDGSTTLISRSHRAGAADPPVPAGVNPTDFSASPDGTQVTFVSGEQLTDDGPGPVYRWTADGDKLVDLFAGLPPLPAGAGISNLRQVSSDGRYLWLEVADGSTTSLAVLDTVAKRLSTKVTVPASPGASPFLNLRYSRDGTKVVFATGESLTGYDQASPACDRFGRNCIEAFLLDATRPEADPECASCGAPGSESAGDVGLGREALRGYPETDVVSNDGRVSFESPQRLSPGDVNDVTDVYEYTPGRGVSLISSGRSDFRAALEGVSATGNDVFFLTTESLVPQDYDASEDIYSARVGGGLPAQQVAPPTAGPCDTGHCPNARASTPVAPLPGTSLFQAAPRAPLFAVGRVSSSARRAAAASGRLVLSVKLGAAGRLAARANATIGRRAVTIGRSSLVARKAERVKLVLRLSRDARRALAREGSLSVAVSVSYSKATKPNRQTVELVAPRRSGSARGGAR